MRPKELLFRFKCTSFYKDKEVEMYWVDRYVSLLSFSNKVAKFYTKLESASADTPSSPI